jgi:hypothetical protein
LYHYLLRQKRPTITKNLEQKEIFALFFVFYLFVYRINLYLCFIDSIYILKKIIMPIVFLPIILEALFATSVATTAYFVKKNADKEYLLRSNGIGEPLPESKIKTVFIYSIVGLVVFGIVRVAINLTKK